MFKISGEKILIAAAIFCFAIFGFFYVFAGPVNNFLPSGKNYIPDRYYLNEDYRDDDPFITKNPGLEQMLKGPIISINDPIQGQAGAPVSLVYFSDFECEFCHNQEAVLREMFLNYKDEVNVIWKDYPDNKEDSPSFLSAVAARCAQAQGQFWPYHDLLFRHQGEFSEEKLVEIALAAGLDKKDFADCLEKKETKNLVLENIEEANALGIAGIPYLFVNQKEIMGEIDYHELEQLIRLELKKSEENAEENK